MQLPLHEIRTGYNGFQSIIDLESKVGECEDNEIEMDLRGLDWLDANMCSPLGAILCRIQCMNRRVSISTASDKPATILRKNGFLEQFGRPRMRDTYETTIEYRRFQRGDSHSFKEYVVQHFRQGTKGLPLMTPLLLKRFRLSLFEILDNAVEHSHTELGIFACGQHFPKQERLDFSIADLGIGIRDKILRERGLSLSPAEAIEWAMKGNTTKRDKTGGLGLTLIREFIEMNQGRLIVVSDAGYWEMSGGKVESNTFPQPFPGTVVTIEINTADKAKYCLASELDPKSIF